MLPVVCKFSDTIGLEASVRMLYAFPVRAPSAVENGSLSDNNLNDDMKHAKINATTNPKSPYSAETALQNSSKHALAIATTRILSSSPADLSSYSSSHKTMTVLTPNQFRNPPLSPRTRARYSRF